MLGVGIATLTPFNSDSGSAIGQTFRAPQNARQAASQIDMSAVQAKFEHAEALRLQMQRVQSEQRAPDGFAEKAYIAQQAYLAELAYDEYVAYKKMSEKRNGSGANGSATNASANRSNQMLANPYGQQVPPTAKREMARVQLNSEYPNFGQPDARSQFADFHQSNHEKSNVQTVAANQPSSYQPSSYQPSRFAPPVHAKPIQKPSNPVAMSFGDDSQPVQIQQVVSRPKANGTPLPLNHRQLGMAPPPVAVAQRMPPQMPSQRNVEQQNNQPRVQQHRQEMVRNAPEPSIQQRSAPSVRVAARPAPMQQNVNPIPPIQHTANGHVGLQDRIASMLSKPQYKKTAQTQASGRSFAVSQPKQIPGLPAQAKSAYGQQVANSRTTRPRIDELSSIADRLTTKDRPAKTRPQRNQSMQQFANQQTNYPVAPVQFSEPVNRLDSEPTNPVRTAAAVRGPDDFEVSFAAPPVHVSPALNGPRVARQEQFRQISILRNKQEEDSQEGFQPSQTLPSPEPNQADPFSMSEPETLKQVDDELERQLREIEEKQNQLRESQQDDGDKEIDQMVDDLDKEIEEKMRDVDSVMDDEESDRSNSSPQQRSCEEFRSQLLGSSIRDIALDISPEASSIRDRFTAISRSWTDRSGQIIATGTMADLRRGYVIIDGMNGRVKFPYMKLSDADLAAISEYWRLPDVCTVGGTGVVGRNWIPQTYTWKATSLCHKPLYFENVQLERYGHTHGPFMQPIQSVGHFFKSLFTLPSQMTHNPPNECQYALGFYRPGNCAPWLKDPIPFSLDGIRRQALITTGAAFIP